MKKISDHFRDLQNKGYKEFFRKIKDFLFSITFQPINKFLFVLYLGYRFAIYKKINFNNKKYKKIIFGTVIFGKKFENSFINYTLQSLIQNKNIPSLLKQGFKIKFIISLEYNENLEKKICDKINLVLLNKNYQIEFHHNENMKSSLLNQYLNKIYEQSVNENAIIWSAHPDHCYSNGSVSNLISMIDSDDCCIAAPHFRVDEDKFIKVFNLNNSEAYNNHEFINVSINCFHKSLLKSFDNQKLNNSWLTGISIKKIHKNKMFVNHIVPTVFVAKINKSDLKFFKKRTYNSFDMSWPSKLLIEKRLRFVSSSDIFFAIELTENNLNEDYKFTYKFNPRNDLKRNMHSNILGSFTYVINYYK